MKENVNVEKKEDVEKKVNPILKEQKDNWEKEIIPFSKFLDEELKKAVDVENSLSPEVMKDKYSQKDYERVIYWNLNLKKIKRAIEEMENL